ncbi:cytochrome c oxidase assembly protein [Novilysobacter arseniciresistens]|uniref:cytochrome c oxidase assembly protein n=1 Tax=Novilysobacter arseniciresistens TaxID=1385522 RepID=UPI0009DCD9F1|nr:cytochrome c oxidase assembly protein [Lysobacter arseniciresistens]
MAAPATRADGVRPAWLAAGLAVLGAAWLGPLPEWSRQSFAAHMLMHMGVVAVAAPLVAAGLARSRFDPARHWPGWFAPMPASALEFVVVWAWHAPALHHAAGHVPELLVVEQGSFLLVGLLVWVAAFGGDAGRRRDRAAAGVAGLLMTSMHMTLLGVLLALASRPLYAGHGSAMLGLSALQDQHLGGVLMLVFGGVAYLLGALVLLAGLLRDRRGMVADG